MAEKLTPLLDGVKANREHWQSLVDTNDQRMDNNKNQKHNGNIVQVWWRQSLQLKIDTHPALSLSPPLLLFMEK